MIEANKLNSMIGRRLALALIYDREENNAFVNTFLSYERNGRYLDRLCFLALWDSFLELRIKLQRATITCNCLPTSAVVDDEELREVVDESRIGLARETRSMEFGRLVQMRRCFERHWRYCWPLRTVGRANGRATRTTRIT